MTRRAPLLAALALLLTVSAGCGASNPARSGGKIRVVAAEDAPQFSIERKTLQDTIARGPSWFIRQVKVRPVVVRDVFYGFEVLDMFWDLPEDQAIEGIEPGDIVQLVNGMPIERPDQFMSAWAALTRAEHLSIRVIRGGRPLLVTWGIRDSRLSAEAPPASTR